MGSFNLPTLPATATPDQITKYVVDAATEVIQTITTATTTAQGSIQEATGNVVANVETSLSSVKTATQGAITDLRASADQSINAVRSTADKAISDFQNLVKELLKLVGQPPIADLAIGDVNGDLFFEPLSCFALLTKAMAENKNRITVRMREPTVARAFQDILGSTKEEVERKAREYVMGKMFPDIGRITGIGGGARGPLMVAEPVSGAGAVTVAGILAAIPPAVWVILAVSLLIVAIGVSIFVVLMGISVIIALFLGYDLENLSLDYQTPLGGVTFGGTLTKRR